MNEAYVKVTAYCGYLPFEKGAIGISTVLLVELGYPVIFLSDDFLLTVPRRFFCYSYFLFRSSVISYIMFVL